MEGSVKTKSGGKMCLTSNPVRLFAISIASRKEKRNEMLLLIGNVFRSTIYKLELELELEFLKTLKNEC